VRPSAAAVLVATSTLLGMVGAVVVPVSAAADVRTPTMGGYSSVGGAGPLLEPFGAIAPFDMAAYMSSHAVDLRTLLSAAPPASDVTVWWGGLQDERRHELALTSSSLVGNLDGIPYAARDAANRHALESQAAAASPASHRAAKLRNVETALRSEPGEPAKSLIGFDTSGEWRASIAVGDLAHADYVTYLVPGMYFSVGEQTTAWVERAEALYDLQRQWLERLGDTESSVAVVAWIGYPTPDVPNSTNLKAAIEGADHLESALLGLRSLRADDEPHVSVVAHSYGSTVALLALQRKTAWVDNLVVLGSPGSDAATVDALGVAPGGVYAAAAPYDPVPVSGFFGSDPMSPEYGATVLSVAGGIDPFSCEALGGSVGHNEYFSDGSRSMRNLALVGIGQGRLAAMPLSD